MEVCLSARAPHTAEREWPSWQTSEKAAELCVAGTLAAPLASQSHPSRPEGMIGALGNSSVLLVRVCVSVCVCLHMLVHTRVPSC